ncbi:hypothetical protein PHISP_06198 [Aspergillus sp. HF37]|nr:hypothetical protein PHISP_06198 [Aspergillus sp. HF37]
MVNLSDVQWSNTQITASLPPRPVAVFVDATNGLGELAMKAFVTHAVQPRVYFVGRSLEAARRVTAECVALNPDGEYILMASDISLIERVDEVCSRIKEKETTINLLFQTQMKTAEDLHLRTSLAYYSRARFTVNLLPLIQQATGLRRVVSVFAATKEEAVNADDFQAADLSLAAMRGHTASLITLSMEAIAQKAPDVAFVHDYPGPVHSGIGRDFKGALWLLALLFRVLGSLFCVPEDEIGERKLFLATSARYAPKMNDESGVPVPPGLSVARGVDANPASGVYSVDSDGEECGPSVMELLGKLRRQGLPGQIWEHTVGEFVRITGRESYA